MTTMQGGAHFEVIARRGHDLAERRLAYYSELYRSGRWARYYSKEHFALRMLDVIKSAKTWRDLASRPWSDHSWTAQPAARDDDLRPAA